MAKLCQGLSTLEGQRAEVKHISSGSLFRRVLRFPLYAQAVTTKKTCFEFRFITLARMSVLFQGLGLAQGLNGMTQRCNDVNCITCYPAASCNI